MTAYRYRLPLIGVLLTVAATLGACASAPHHPAAKDQLLTYITTTGQKQFTFTETRQHSGGGRHGHSGMGGHGGMGGMGGMGHMGHMGGGFGGAMTGGGDGGEGATGGYAQDSDARLAHLQEAVKQRLDAQLKATGYCRNSYKELSSQFQHGQIQINGQCMEPATAQDRKRFPNS